MGRPRLQRRIVARRRAELGEQRKLPAVPRSGPVEKTRADRPTVRAGDADERSLPSRAASTLRTETRMDGFTSRRAACRCDEFSRYVRLDASAYHRSSYTSVLASQSTSIFSLLSRLFGSLPFFFPAHSVDMDTCVRRRGRNCVSAGRCDGAQSTC